MKDWREKIFENVEKQWWEEQQDDCINIYKQWAMLNVSYFSVPMWIG